RARPRVLVHDAARRQAHLRRGPRRGLGQCHETPHAGPLSAREAEGASASPVRNHCRAGFPCVGNRRCPIPLAIPAQPTARRRAACAPHLAQLPLYRLGLLYSWRLRPGTLHRSHPRLPKVIASRRSWTCCAVASLQSRWGMPLVWVFNLWGSADLLYAFYQGNSVGFAPGQLGAAFFIPTFVVPLLLITHGLMFRLLLQGEDVRAST